ncbi:MAG: hypothetical protein AAGD14_17990 [Planctomycetota bacterium]
MRIAAVLCLLASGAFADQLTPYGEKNFYSDNGQWVLETKEKGGKLAYVLKTRAGKVRGQGVVDQLPIDAAVFKDGTGFILWGRYGGSGSGIGVARYEFDGKRAWGLEFNRIFREEEIADFPRTLSFVFWADHIWIDPRRGVAVGTATNRTARLFNMRTGEIKPGGNDVVMDSLRLDPPPARAILTAGKWMPEASAARLQAIADDKKLPLLSRVTAAGFMKPDARWYALLDEALEDSAAAPTAVAAAERCLPPDEARDFLVRAARNEALLRRAVALLAGSKSAQGLVELLSHGDSPTSAKVLAARYLKARPTADVLPSLLKEFGDADLDTAVQMLDVLIAVGDKRLPARLQPHQVKLIELINRPGANVEWLAQCFQKYPTTEAVKPLLKAARKHASQRPALFKALRACSGLQIGDDLGAWERAVR